MPRVESSSKREGLKRAARSIFDETLSRLEPQKAIAQKLRSRGPELLIDSTIYDLRLYSHLFIVAVGKAAVPMTAAVLRWLDSSLRPEQSLQGIVVGTSLPVTPDARMVYRLGSHPLPDRTALQAADLILSLLRPADEKTLVFFLVSGGASAMVEQPLSPEVQIAELNAFYELLVHSGLPIAEMNTLRKHLSRIKGGGLAVAAGRARQCTLLVSDVPPTQPQIVGSGLSMPDDSTLADCRYLLETRLSGCDVPTSVHRAFYAANTPETPKSQDCAFHRASFHMLLSSDDLRATASEVACAHGFQAVIEDTPDDWGSEQAADYLLNRLTALQAEQQPICLIAAGELSVELKGTPGRGGRNQQFVLECARRWQGVVDNVVVLSAGSDGLDGNSIAAGALADPTTRRRAEAAGFSVEEALTTFNAFPLLHTLGDTIVMGPSGNNLRDLRLLLFRP